MQVPDVHWELTTDKVLTMDYYTGGSPNDLQYMRDNDIDPVDVSRDIGALYSQMIFVTGYVHCDPHPGNVLIRKDAETGSTKVVLLDHGLYTVSITH